MGEIAPLDDTCIKDWYEKIYIYANCVFGN